MSDLTLYFECEPSADASTLQAELQQGLEQAPNVQSAETSKTEALFTGLEILAAVTLAASILHQGAGAAHDLRAIVADLKATFQDVADLCKKFAVKKVRVPVGMEPKPIEELTDADYQTIAQELISGSDA